jgi:hypothetical protein
MTTMPPAPDEPAPPAPGSAARNLDRAGAQRAGLQRTGAQRAGLQRAGLAAWWAVVLDRFRDYLHWAAIVTEEPRHSQGAPHEQDT